MQFRLTYTAQDWVDAYRVHLRKRSTLLNRVFFSLSVPLGIVSIFLFAILPLAAKTIKLSGAVIPTLMGFWLIYFGTSYISRLARRSYTSRPERQAEFSVTVDESGVRMTNAISSTEYKWPCFVGWLETEKVLLLYVSFCAFEFFPKRVFTPEQLEQLRLLADGHVKSPKQRAASA